MEEKKFQKPPYNPMTEEELDKLLHKLFHRVYIPTKKKTWVLYPPLTLKQLKDKNND